MATNEFPSSSSVANAISSSSSSAEENKQYPNVLLDRSRLIARLNGLLSASSSSKFENIRDVLVEMIEENNKNLLGKNDEEVQNDNRFITSNNILFIKLKEEINIAKVKNIISTTTTTEGDDKENDDNDDEEDDIDWIFDALENACNLYTNRAILRTDANKFQEEEEEEPVPHNFVEKKSRPTRAALPETMLLDDPESLQKSPLLLAEGEDVTNVNIKDVGIVTRLNIA